ncbi:MAG: diaminopimelate epimerase [Victivallales bacterium]|nr:diaminopimelate epimerase [Victivallales bacterium]
MSQVKFTKMHGLGNDYIYFNCLADPHLIPDPDAVAPRLSDRHFGIGGDGIVLIQPSTTADYRMRMFNADGSESEMCGNAIRCVARYLCDRGYLAGDQVAIETGAGIKRIVVSRNAAGKFLAARVDMGEPILNGPDIPVAIDRNPVVGAEIDLKSGRKYAMTCVSMGNPHAVIFVDRITDEQVLQDGRELEQHPLFPRKTNVEFARILSRRDVEMRVWERGTGETLACGTGASATGVAAILNGLTERKMTLHLSGGELEIEWSAADNHVFMTGPATFVCDGVVEI